MPKYPVGYLRVESVRHESVRADSRKRLNSSSQLGPRSQIPVVHVLAHIPVCRNGRARGRMSDRPSSTRSQSHPRCLGPPLARLRGGRGATVDRGPGPAARSGAGPPRERETVSGRLVVDSSKVRTMGERAEPQRQLRNRPGGRPATGATSSTAPGAPARPARRHGVSDSVSDVSRDRGGLRRPSLAQERAESGPSSHDETARSRTAAERRRRSFRSGNHMVYSINTLSCTGPPRACVSCTVSATTVGVAHALYGGANVATVD